MSEFVFQPLLSFNAKCYWQFTDANIGGREWKYSGDLVKPLWVEFNDWNGDDGWIMSGRDYHPDEVQSHIYRLFPGQRPRIYCEHFWFGVFRFGDAYAYEIRPAYVGENSDRWPELEYQMGMSNGGYLGMYATNLPAGTSPLSVPSRLVLHLPDPIPDVGVIVPDNPLPEIETAPLSYYPAGSGTSLWGIEGLEPEGLSEGDLHTDLVLVSPSGRTVRRQLEKGRAYLNDQKGKRGKLTLQIVNAVVPPHPGLKAPSSVR
ncbi:hypothetical protein ACYU03_09520 [Pseudomonas sp. X10]